MYLTLPPRRDILDLFTFVIIFFAAKGRGARRHPGIPTILDTIFRDATIYFVVMFLCQILAEVFSLVNAVGCF